MVNISTARITYSQITAVPVLNITALLLVLYCLVIYLWNGPAYSSSLLEKKYADQFVIT